MGILIIIAIFTLGVIAGFFLTVLIVAHSATKRARDEKKLKAEITRIINKKKEQQK